VAKVSVVSDTAGGKKSVVQNLLKDGPIGAGAAGGLGEHPIAAGTLQAIDLEVWLLVGGGDAGIAE
jgi:hypothetical protein